MFEVLVVTLGAVAAKVTLSIWLNEPSIAIDSAGSVVDSLLDLVGNKIQARRLDRNFQTIAEKIAERLEYLIEIEYPNLAEDEVAEVSNIAAKQLDAISITPKLLTEINFDQDILFRTLKVKTKKENNDLTSSQQSLLEIFLREACAYAVNIASKLPTVTTASLAEILRREDILISEIHEISANIRKIQEQVYRSSTALGESQYSHDYKRALERRVNSMELFGTQLDDRSKNYPLSLAYINLSIQEVTNTIPDVTTSTVLELLETYKYLLVRGPAGSGKTTILKWVALNMVQGTFSEIYEKWNNFTPFLIRLRECSTLPPPEQFPEFVAPTIAHEMPHNWVHEKLRSGSAVVLIDGVDEIDRRDAVTNWINELTHMFPNTYYIVTSRPLPKTDPWKVPEGFEQAAIKPMSMGEIQKLVEYWHRAITPFGATEEEQTLIDNLQREAVSIIQSKSAIYELARTPILCAMICALNRSQLGNIPTKRLELYEACTQMLIDLREVQRAITTENIPLLNYKQKKSMLSKLANYFVINGYSEVVRSKAKNQLVDAIRQVPTLHGSTTPSRLLDFFVVRTGMLREPSKGVIDFPHRTFQEYLASIYIVDQDNIKLLVNNATNSQWREVIILSAGSANQTQRIELLEGILARADTEPHNSHQLILLAVACLDSVTTLEPNLWNDINNRLRQLIPPTNVEDLQALASAGDLAVPHLRKYDGPYIEFVLRTLELIKTSSSVQALANYIDYNDDNIILGLETIFQRLDRDKLGREILDQIHIPKLIVDSVSKLSLAPLLRSIREITISQLRSETFPELSHLTVVETLKLNNCPNLQSLNSFTTLAQLTTLKLANCANLLDISDVKHLKNLENLHLFNLPLIELPIGLIYLHQLKQLRLERIKIEAIQGLSNSPLKVVEIRHCPRLKDIRGLERLDNLKTLIIENTLNIAHFNDVITKLPNLKQLELIYPEAVPLVPYYISDDVRHSTKVTIRNKRYNSYEYSS